MRLTNWYFINICFVIIIYQKELPKIAKVIFKGNPIYMDEKIQFDEPGLEVLRRVDTLTEIDGTIITEK